MPPPFEVQGRCVQSRRDCIFQPRVARNELPWVDDNNPINPEGLQRTGPGVALLHKLAYVYSSTAIDTTLAGLKTCMTRTPRVARSSQPWAERFHPVGMA